MNPLLQLFQLAKEADAKLNITFNAPDVLPYAIEALEIIASHPELRAEFEQAFLEMPNHAPTEFIEVCMHELRWGTVMTEYERRYRSAVDRNDWSVEPVYRHYLESFEDGWENADDFYSSYFRNVNDR